MRKPWHWQPPLYAILRIAKKMGNPAKSARVARCRDTEKSKINSPELTFMKKITPKIIATFDPLLRNSLSPATAGLLIPLLLACFGVAPMAQAVGPDTEGAIPGSNNGEGSGVLVSRITGIWNTGTGFEALNHLTAGNQNTATGLRALFSDTNGGFNTATGVFSLFSNTSGFFNSATGAYSLANNTIGNYNTANGYSGLHFNTEGDANTGSGFAALYRNTIGLANTAIGVSALRNNTTGSFNVALGNGAGFNVSTADNVIAIGAGGENVSNSCYIGNIFGVTSSGATAVYVNTFGRLGTLVSSRRFKEEVKPMDKASEAILALKPVTFRYKEEIDPARSPQFGLVAEDVEKVNPDLVVRDAEGKVNTVRYDAVNAMLLNEFLKAHRKVEEQARKVQEQEATIAELKKDFRATVAQLTARLEEQAAQIQNVSARLEVGKFATGRIRRGGPAPRTVVDNH
jgi:hypothetical protein